MKNNKVAVIIGAGPGLGSALAHKFTSEGYKVAIVARTKRKLQKIQKDIESSGGEVFSVSADVTKEADLNSAFDKIFRTLGKNIDVLVYNAGEFKMQSILKMKPVEFKTSWEINCYGAFLSIQHALPSMLKRKIRPRYFPPGKVRSFSRLMVPSRSTDWRWSELSRIPYTPKGSTPPSMDLNI